MRIICPVLVCFLLCTLMKHQYFTRRAIPTSGNLILELDTDACKGAATEINYLEHVQAIVTLNSTRRGDLTMYLLSPSGTR